MSNGAKVYKTRTQQEYTEINKLKISQNFIFCINGDRSFLFVRSIQRSCYEIPQPFPTATSVRWAMNRLAPGHRCRCGVLHVDLCFNALRRSYRFSLLNACGHAEIQNSFRLTNATVLLVVLASIKSGSHLNLYIILS